MANGPIGTRALTDILLQGHESKALDYKAAMGWSESDKAGCCALVKDILAMANIGGGFIAIGVSETQTGYSLDGVSPNQAKSFDTTRINRFLQVYSDPPINALLRKISHDGKTFVIIEVPGFTDTPHICQRDFPSVLTAPCLYIRTDNNESAPIRSASDFRLLVERAVRNRSDSLLASFRAILTTGVPEPQPAAQDRFLAQRQQAIERFNQINPLKQEEPLLGYMDFSFYPERFDPTRLPIENLRPAVERAHVTYTGWPFLFINANRPDSTYAIQDGLETFIQTKDFGNNYLMDFWRLHQSGFFYQRTLLRPSVHQSETERFAVASTSNIAIYVAQAIDCLARLYADLFEESEYVSLDARVLNTDGRALVAPSDLLPLWETWETYRCRIPEITVQRRLPLAEWRAGVVDHAVDITNEIYLRFNWNQPDLDSARRTIQRMFARQW